MSLETMLTLIAVIISAVVQLAGLAKVYAAIEHRLTACETRLDAQEEKCRENRMQHRKEMLA